MSTRTQIRFIDHNGGVAQIYRHHDGYPESVVPSIKEAFQVMSATGTIRGAGYVSANYIFFNKLRSMRLYEDELPQKPTTEPETFEPLNQAGFLLGYGVESPGKWHGDEEYLYEVHFDRDGVEEIKVSGHSSFPRWGDLDALEEIQPWSHVTWEYEGDLAGALEQYEE